MAKSVNMKQHTEFIMYRLDVIEKRLDYLEKNIKPEHPEVLHLILDMLKKDVRIQPDCTVETPKTKLESYDGIISSMDRRRTIM
jgi:hypothetical protein